MDTKGREELLGMQSCQSYQGCPVCTHRWSPGSLVGRTQCVCDGYRRFLSTQSRARRKKFHFRGHEYQYRYEREYKIFINVTINLKIIHLGISKREVRQRNVTMNSCDELLGSLPTDTLSLDTSPRLCFVDGQPTAGLE